LRRSDLLATVRLTDAAGAPFVTLSWNGRPREEWNVSGGQIEFGTLPPGSWTVDVTTSDGRSWQGTAQTDASRISEVFLE